MPQLALNSLLLFSPQWRHSFQTHPPLLWDLKHSPSHARPAASPHHHLPSSSRAHLATSPGTTSIRITCGIFPHDFGWHIDVRNPRGVTVGDVLDAIYAGLRHGVTRSEWNRTSHTQKARVAEAFTARTQRSSNPRWEYSQGVRRIDWLLKHTTFVGLTPSMDSPYTWTLATKRADQ